MATTIIAVAAVAAVAASAYGAYASAQARSEAADYNSDVNKNNEILAKQQADIDARNLDEKQRRLRAAQRVAYGAAGVEEEGSPLLVMADTAAQQAQDLYLTRYGGQARAAQFAAEAGLQSLYSRRYGQAGAYGAGTSLLSGGVGVAASSYYGRYGYYGYGQQTAGGSDPS